MRVTLDRSIDAAYLELRTSDEVTRGVASDTVTLEGLEESEGISALGSIHLDFDALGRLIGIEVLRASTNLPASLLAGAERL